MYILRGLDAFSSSNMYAPGTVQNVYVFPIITGTSYKSLGFCVQSHSCFKILVR